MSQITVILQGLFWAVLGYFGVTHLPNEVQQYVAPTLAGIAGLIGPALTEWRGRLARYAPLISTACVAGIAFVAWLVAKQHMNQQLAGVLDGLLIGVAQVFVPSSAHPSRLPEPAAPPA